MTIGKVSQLFSLVPVLLEKENIKLWSLSEQIKITFCLMTLTVSMVQMLILLCSVWLCLWKICASSDNNTFTVAIKWELLKLKSRKLSTSKWSSLEFSKSTLKLNILHSKPKWKLHLILKELSKISCFCFSLLEMTFCPVAWHTISDKHLLKILLMLSKNFWRLLKIMLLVLKN